MSRARLAGVCAAVSSTVGLQSSDMITAKVKSPHVPNPAFNKAVTIKSGHFRAAGLKDGHKTKEKMKQK